MRERLQSVSAGSERLQDRFQSMIGFRSEYGSKLGQERIVGREVLGHIGGISIGGGWLVKG